MNFPKHNKSYLIATSLGWLALIIWSLAASFASFVKSIPPFLLTAYVNAFALTFNFFFHQYSCYIDKKPIKLPKMPKLDRSFFLILFSLAFNQLFFLSAFKYTRAEEADLIIYLWPILVLILVNIFVSKSNALWVYLICALISFTALAHFLSEGETLFTKLDRGHLLALCSAITWSLYTVCVKRSPSNQDNTLIYTFAFTALFFFLIHFIEEQSYRLNWQEYSVLFVYGFVIQGLAYKLWNYAIVNGSYSALSLLSYLNPLLSIGFLIIFGYTQFSFSLINTCLIISLSSLIAFLYRYLAFPYQKKSLPSEE
ncbi:MAG: EamA family transporter [Chlamydiales bacterium]|nr:EamA family transporter [Chlamydiales bacterium]